MTRLFIIVLLSFLIALGGSAQQNEPLITTFSSQHGIPPLKISKIATDSSGYLWIGSNLGLHRFDGKTFKTYSSVPKTIIADIQVDRDGTVIVVFMNEGLGLYDEDVDSFKIIDVHEAFNKRGGLNCNITFIQGDRILFSQNGSGIFEYIKSSEKFISVIEKGFIDKIIPHPNDENKLLLVADSLFSLDLRTMKLDMISPKYIYDLVVDDEGYLWFIAHDNFGISKFDLEIRKEEFIPWDFKQYPQIEELLYNHGAVWLSSDLGLSQFTINSKEWQHYNNGLGVVSGAYFDQQNRLWFGQNNNLNVIDPQNQNFVFIPETKGYTYTAMEKISEDEILFAPFHSKELQLYNLKTKKFSVLPLPMDYQYLNYPMDMHKFGEDVFITYGNGIGKYHFPTGNFNTVQFTRYNDFFKQNHKKSIHTDASGTFWISALSQNALFKIDLKSLKIDSINFHVPKDEFRQQIKILENGEIILPSELGLIKVDFETGNQHILPFEKDGKGIDLGYIDALLVAKEEVWIIGNGRTFKARIQGSRIKIEKEFPSGAAFDYNIGLDVISIGEQENLILTSGGINFYAENTEESNFYGMKEGLVNVDKRMKVKSFGDELFFLSQGVTYARKSTISRQSYQPKLSFTSFVANGKNLLGKEELFLKPGSNDVKIGFVSIDLTKPLDVQYRYRLSQEDPWISVDYNANEIYLLNLKGGKYEFEVMAKHRHSEWSPIQTLLFELGEPVWKKWWFILMSFSIFGLLSYLFYKRQLRRSKEISDMETRMAELENEALRAQMNPHFIFNSLNSIKSYIIDHEKEEAADYLTDFSDLIRLILANSREKIIPLAKELEALELYMDIENVRLEDKFKYTINNDVEDVYIQPLTLQPFIENAIWHGFIHKKGKGNLKIDIKRVKDNVLIEIDDDGVGRKRSTIIEKKHDRKRSFGILITKERLAQNDVTENIQIIDKDDQAGTIVRVRIPYLTSKNKSL